MCVLTIAIIVLQNKPPRNLVSHENLVVCNAADLGEAGLARSASDCGSWGSAAPSVSYPPSGACTSHGQWKKPKRAFFGRSLF